ncbi:MAG: hypothetical protein CMN02_02395 [Roseibacillus sp.]|nr:hypothetical protein [Roseibacillus sp.]
MHLLIGWLPGRHVAINNHVVDRQCAFLDIPVADKMKRTVLPGAVATGAILMDQRCDVLIKSDFGRAGQQRTEEQQGEKKGSGHGWVED